LATDPSPKRGVGNQAGIGLSFTRGRPMYNLSRKTLVVITLVITAIVVASLSLSYTYVRVSGPDGEIVVEKAAFGAQHAHVEGPGGTVVECEAR
jgi:hypothetical protein